MIFQNVYSELFWALRKNQYFMYHIPSQEKSYQVYHITIEKILSIYEDIIVVNNMDKRINVENQNMASLIPFKVVYIDEYQNIFALPMFIDGKTIDLIKLGSNEALCYADDNLCQAISLALMELSRPIFYCGRYYSSLDQLPHPVQVTLWNESKDETYHKDISTVLNTDPGEPDIANSCSEYGIPHNIPIEEIQVRFDPNDIGNRGIFKAGYLPEELENERNISEDFVRIAVTKEKLPKENVHSFKFEPTSIGNKTLFPALKKIVDVDEEVIPVEEREKKQKTNQSYAPLLVNPIGFIDKKDE